ncbi:MAG: M56 family metallopeptidase [Cellulosilyticaceae bacterium]
MENLIQWAVMSTVTIGIFEILRILLKGKIKATWQYMLWGIVLIRLLFPTLPSSSLSWFNAIGYDAGARIVQSTDNPLQTTNLNNDLSQTSSQTEPADALTNTLNSEKNAIVQQPDPHSTYEETYPNINYWLSMSPKTVLITLWISGVIVTTMYFGVMNKKVKKKLKSLPNVESTQANYTIKRLMNRLDITSNIVFKISDIPMIYGIHSPIVVLPTEYSKEELEGIVLHELIHYKYKDTSINLLQMLIICLHWYNPIVWWGMRQMKQDGELACDERVCKWLVNKRIYAQSLIKISTTSSGFTYMGNYMSPTGKQLKRRIQAMGKLNKQTKIGTGMAVIGAIVIGIGCLSNPIIAKANNQTKQEAKPFRNDKQVEKASPSGKYTLVLDTDDRAITGPEKDGLYIVSKTGKVSTDYMQACRSQIELKLGKVYLVKPLEYKWKAEGDKEMLTINIEAHQKGVYQEASVLKLYLTGVIDPDKGTIQFTDKMEKVVAKLVLTEKEKELYSQYIDTEDLKILKDATPIQIVKLYEQCVVEAKGDAAVKLIIVNEDKEGIAKNISDTNVRQKNREVIRDKWCGFLDKATIQSIDASHLSVTTPVINNDRLDTFTWNFVKEEGIWKWDLRRPN